MSPSDPVLQAAEDLHQCARFRASAFFALAFALRTVAEAVVAIIQGLSGA
jgi:hypothetical protein